MPEGPQVRSFYNKTKDIFVGKLIYAKNLTNGKFAKIPYDASIKKYCYKGKKIFLYLNDKVDRVFVLSFGLTGELVLESEVDTGDYVRFKRKHMKYEFKTENGVVYYSDVLNFGSVKEMSIEDADHIFKSIGPDMTQDTIEMQAWREIVDRHKRMKLADFLINQNIISGIGNMYRSEIIYTLRVHPLVQMKDLSQSQVDRLPKIIQKILSPLYELRVYGKDADAHGREITKLEYKGRSIYYVRPSAFGMDDESDDEANDVVADAITSEGGECTEQVH